MERKPLRVRLMAKKNPVCRQFGLTLCAWFVQGVVALFCILVFMYIASLIIKPLDLVGITSIPPGIAYWDYKDRSYQETLGTQARF